VRLLVSREDLWFKSAKCDQRSLYAGLPTITDLVIVRPWSTDLARARRGSRQVTHRYGLPPGSFGASPSVTVPVLTDLVTCIASIHTHYSGTCDSCVPTLSKYFLEKFLERVFP